MYLGQLDIKLHHFRLHNIHKYFRFRLLPCELIDLNHILKTIILYYIILYYIILNYSQFRMLQPEFNVLLLVYKALNDLTPHISDVLSFYIPATSRKSSTAFIFLVFSYPPTWPQKVIAVLKILIQLCRDMSIYLFSYDIKLIMKTIQIQISESYLFDFN